MAKDEILSLKSQGNSAHQVANYRQAIYFFTKAIELAQGTDFDQTYLLYSNRSASYSSFLDHVRALADAEIVIRLKTDWAKGYSRKATALFNLGRYEEAVKAYKAGIALDAQNETMVKGYQDAKEAVARAEKSVPFLQAIPSSQAVESLRQLNSSEQLPHVRWRFEILQDRIWLSDPPQKPFRPRSLFMVDVNGAQMLGMAPHTTRDPIAITELLQFLVQSCETHRIRPGVIEVSDTRLHQILAPQLNLIEVKVELHNVATEELENNRSTDPVTQLLQNTIRNFDERERQQWKDNPKFAGVIKQRDQPGLLTVRGTTLRFLRYLMAAAHRFYRSRAFLYYAGPYGITVTYPTIEGHSSVTHTAAARITLDRPGGNYGLAMTTLEACDNSQDCGVHSYQFQDPSNIPFDDADLIDRYGWDVVEGAYPLPLVHVSSSDTHSSYKLIRPSFEDLMWYEAVFHALTVFIEKTFADPLYTPSNDHCEEVVVTTHQGLTNVRISIPPANASLNPQMVTQDKESARIVEEIHNLLQKAESASRPSNNATELASQNTTQSVTSPIKGSTSFTASVTGPSSPPALPRGTSAESGKWSAEAAILPEFRKAWDAEVVQREGLLQRLSTVIFASSGDSAPLRYRVLDQDKQIADMKKQIEQLQTKLDWKSTLLGNQNDLISQLQLRISQIERSEMKLRTENENLLKTPYMDSKVITAEVTNHINVVLKALNVTQEEIRHWSSIMQQASYGLKEKELALLQKPVTEESIKTLESEISSSKQRILDLLAPKVDTSSNSALLPVSVPGLASSGFSLGGGMGIPNTVIPSGTVNTAMAPILASPSMKVATTSLSPPPLAIPSILPPPTLVLQQQQPLQQQDQLPTSARFQPYPGVPQTAAKLTPTSSSRPTFPSTMMFSTAGAPNPNTATWEPVPTLAANSLTLPRRPSLPSTLGGGGIVKMLPERTFYAPYTSPEEISVMGTPPIIVNRPQTPTMTGARAAASAVTASTYVAPPSRYVFDEQPSLGYVRSRPPPQHSSREYDYDYDYDYDYEYDSGVYASSSRPPPHPRPPPPPSHPVRMYDGHPPPRYAPRPPQNPYYPGSRVGPPPPRRPMPMAPW